MKIYSVYDPEFKHYGQIVEGLDDACQEILEALRTTPMSDAPAYVPVDEVLQELPAMTELSEHLYGGMPIQLGWCNGHNTRLNCLEYHRDSEYNMSTENVIMLFARQDEITDGVLDTSKVKAFWLPAGVMIEVFATTLHYAPCHTDPDKGYRVLVVLPWATNTEKPDITPRNWEDRLLRARNKWLLAHPDTAEAADGAYVGLIGENIDIADQI